MSFKRVMSLIAMAFLWTGSQIPLYLLGWLLLWILVSQLMFGRRGSTLHLP